MLRGLIVSICFVGCCYTVTSLVYIACVYKNVNYFQNVSFAKLKTIEHETCSASWFFMHTSIENVQKLVPSFKISRNLTESKCWYNGIDLNSADTCEEIERDPAVATNLHFLQSCTSRVGRETATG